MFTIGAPEILLLVTMIILPIFVIWPTWRICAKAGFPGMLSLVIVVPIFNLFLLYFLAFAEWPSLHPRKEARHLICDYVIRARQKRLGLPRHAGFSDSLEDRLDGRRRVTFQPVVHEYKCRLLGLKRLLGDQLHAGPRVFIRFLDSLVGLERLHGRVIGRPSLEQRPHDHEIRGERLQDLGLLIELRHARPGVEDMGDVVIRQDTKVLRRQIILVADLDRILEPYRQRLQERIQQGQEIGRRREGLLVERAELENQRTDLRP